MATRLALRARLQRRLGLGVVSALEEERLNEALNSGIARAISDKVPGLSHDTFVGSVLGTLSMDTAVTAVSSGSVTLDGADALTSKAMPHDILVVDVSGTKTKFLIRDVIDATHVDIGVPASAILNGGSASTIERRALLLPSSGQVVSVYRVNASGRSARLSYDPLIAQRDPFETGTPRYFEQRYSIVQGSSFVSLWPAPTDITDQFTVVQTRFFARLSADVDTLPFPEEALDAILERSRFAYITWAGTHASTTVALAEHSVRDSADSLKNTSSSHQVVVKQ